MSEGTSTDEPNGLTALAAETAGGPWTFTVGDKTGTLRMQDFGDLMAWSAKTGGAVDKMMVLIRRCADPVALELLAGMTISEGIATYNRWEAWVNKLEGK